MARQQIAHVARAGRPSRIALVVLVSTAGAVSAGCAGGGMGDPGAGASSGSTATEGSPSQAAVGGAGGGSLASRGPAGDPPATSAGGDPDGGMSPPPPCPFVAVPPVMVSPPGASCDLSRSNAGRKIGVDQGLNLYVAMRCDDTTLIATSTDRGVTYDAPVSTVPFAEFAISGGPDGVAYLAGQADGSLVVQRSVDTGRTFSPPGILDQALDRSISIATRGDNVYLANRSAAGATVYRNADRGAGPFLSTPAGFTAIGFTDVLVDDTNGDIWVTSDSPDLRFALSTDGGASFGPTLRPAGTAFFSDWGIGGGRILGSASTIGSNVAFFWIDPVTSASIPGTIAAFSGARAVAVDADGTGTLVQRNDTSGSIELYRIARDATTADSVRVIAPAGANPGIVALPNNCGVGVIYTDPSGSVWATVVVF
jgi:hypothetical protein